MLTDDGDLEERRTRSARNQTVFREVNERIVELSQRWTTTPQFICECENPRCAETITATVDQYEAVRGAADPGTTAPDQEEGRPRRRGPRAATTAPRSGSTA